MILDIHVRISRSIGERVIYICVYNIFIVACYIIGSSSHHRSIACVALGSRLVVRFLSKNRNSDYNELWMHKKSKIFSENLTKHKQKSTKSPRLVSRVTVQATILKDVIEQTHTKFGWNASSDSWIVITCFVFLYEWHIKSAWANIVPVHEYTQFKFYYVINVYKYL